MNLAVQYILVRLADIAEWVLTFWVITVLIQIAGGLL